MAPLPEGGVVAEDAVVTAIEAAGEEVGLGALVVEGDGGDDADGDGVLGIHDGPRDLVDEVAVGRDPAADDLAIGLPANDEVGLAAGLVADDAGHDDGGAVGGDGADGELKGGGGQVVALDVETVVRAFGGGGG